MSEDILTGGSPLMTPPIPAGDPREWETQAILGKGTSLVDLGLLSAANYPTDGSKTYVVPSGVSSRFVGEITAMGDLTHTALSDRVEVTPFSPSDADTHWRKRKFIDGLADDDEGSTFEVTLNYIYSSPDLGTQAVLSFEELFDFVDAQDRRAVSVFTPHAESGAIHATRDTVTSYRGFVLDCKYEQVVFQGVLDAQLAARLIFKIYKISYIPVITFA